MIYCGIDWAEQHHDIALVDDHGKQVAKRRIGDDATGFAVLLEHPRGSALGFRNLASDIARLLLESGGLEPDSTLNCEEPAYPRAGRLPGGLERQLLCGPALVQRGNRRDGSGTSHLLQRRSGA